MATWCNAHRRVDYCLDTSNRPESNFWVYWPAGGTTTGSYTVPMTYNATMTTGTTSTMRVDYGTGTSTAYPTRMRAPTRRREPEQFVPDVLLRTGPPPQSVRTRERMQRRNQPSNSAMDRHFQTADRSEFMRHRRIWRRLEERKYAALFQLAQDKARKLLLMILSPGEREHFLATGDLVITSQFGNLYRICAGYNNGNVVHTDQHGCRLQSWCAQPRVSRTAHHGVALDMPEDDIHAGQILQLKYDEERFFQHANSHGGNRICAHTNAEVVRRRYGQPSSQRLAEVVRERIAFPEAA